MLKALFREGFIFLFMKVRFLKDHLEYKTGASAYVEDDNIARYWIRMKVVEEVPETESVLKRVKEKEAKKK